MSLWCGKPCSIFKAVYATRIDGFCKYATRLRTLERHLLAILLLICDIKQNETESNAPSGKNYI
jgi:hypothetical protein